MSKEKLNTTELRNKILKGLDLAFERLILKKQKDDGEFVFSKDGQIVVVKAIELASK